MPITVITQNNTPAPPPGVFTSGRGGGLNGSGFFAGGEGGAGRE